MHFIKKIKILNPISKIPCGLRGKEKNQVMIASKIPDLPSSPSIQTPFSPFFFWFCGVYVFLQLKNRSWGAAEVFLGAVSCFKILGLRPRIIIQGLK